MAGTGRVAASTSQFCDPIAALHLLTVIKMSLVYHAQAVVIRLLTWLYDLLQLGAVFDAFLKVVMRVTELDVVPDIIIRSGIRLLLKIRLQSVSAGD